MYFANNLDGWQISRKSDLVAVLSGGTIQTTTDGGINWTTDYRGPYNAFNGLDFINSKIGWVLVEPNTNRLTSLVISNQVELLQTIDAGATWRPIVATTSNEIRYINFISAQDGLAIDSTGQLLETSNAGLTWTAVASAPARIGSLCQASADAFVGNGRSVFLEQSDGTWKSILTDIYLSQTTTGAGVPISFVLSCRYNTIVASVLFPPRNMQGESLAMVDESLNGGKSWQVIMSQPYGAPSVIGTISGYYTSLQGPTSFLSQIVSAKLGF